MTLRLLTYLLIHLRPREGWLPLLLLFGAAGCLVWSVLGVGWVPEDGIVIPTALLGLLLYRWYYPEILLIWAGNIVILSLKHLDEITFPPRLKRAGFVRKR